MNKNLEFHRSLSPGPDNTITPKYWDKTVEAFENGRFIEVIPSLLNYINPDILKNTKVNGKGEWAIPHGSVIIFLKTDDRMMSVRAPYLNIAGSKSIPLLRQMVQLNFSPLNQAQIVLQGDVLEFRYSCPLSLCEPYKIYDVFREICIYADTYDDEFMKKFEAKRIEEPRVHQYTEAKKREAIGTLKDICTKAIENITHFEDRREYPFAFQVAAISLLQIEYYLSAQGSLRSELEKMIAYLNSPVPVPDKIRKVKELLREFMDKDEKELGEDLYRIDVFIPYKLHANVQKLRSMLEPTMMLAKKLIESGETLAASLAITHDFLNLFYNNEVTPDLKEFITKALEESSGKPWPQSAKVLYLALGEIVSGKEISQDKGPFGFIRKLFQN